MKKIFILISLSFLLLGVKAQPMSGTYTVGSGGTYTTLTAAYNALKSNGINGPVIFKINNGVYNESISIIGSISGASDTNIVIVTSAAENADSVVFTGNSVLSLMNASHFTFTKVTFDATKGGYAVFISGNTDNIEISHCHIYADSLSTATIAAGIYKGSGSGIANNVRIIGNTINGGYYGIYFYGGISTFDYGTNVLIDSNMITNQYYIATYFQYTDFTSVSHNNILSRLANTTINWYGFYFYYCNFIADGNKIHQRATSITSPYLAYLNYVGSNNTTSPSVFSNNELIGYSTGPYYGISAGTSKGAYNNLIIANNSIYMSGPGLSSNIYIGNNVASNYDIKNNILVNASSGYPIYFAGTTTPMISDYNCLYGLTNVGYFSKAHTTLSSWQASTRQDNNSISVNPSFISATNLKLTSYNGFECLRMPEVGMDNQNYLRSSVTYMGAYSKVPSGIDAELVEFVGFSDAYANGGNHPISVVIRNVGFDAMTSASITAKINNVNITPIPYTASIPLVYGATDTVSLGSFVFNLGINNIMAAVNTIGDTLQGNDTIRSSRYMCPFIIGGEYVIGNSPTADYPSEDSLMADALRCGINADVTLKFESGTYTALWDLTDLGYFMNNYTLTVTSAANHRDSVVFANTSGALLTFKNTHNVVFKNVTLNATAGYYAIQFKGNASNITFDSCNILASSTATTSSYAAIYKATSTGSLNGLSIKHCFISGGYYGVYMYGTSDNYANGLILDSNIIANQYYFGVYCYFVNAISTSYNTIRPRSVNQNTMWYGIYLYDNRNGNIISNRIYADNAGITYSLYGIYNHFVYNSLVANNQIYLNSSASTTCGISISFPMVTNYLHNSVLITGSSNDAVALLWNSSGNYNATLKNNIFVCNSSGKKSYAISLTGTYSSADAHNYRIDYNNYYSSGNMGYVGSIQPTLVDWQTIVGSDQNSTFLSPNYVNVTQNLKLNDYSSYLCPLINDVSHDIENSVRYQFTAKGAYEAVLLDVDAFLIHFDTTSLIYNQSTPVTVTLMNFGITTLTSATIQWTFNGVSQTPYSWTGSLSTHASTVINLGNVISVVGINNIVAWVSSPNNTTDSNSVNDTIYFSVYVCSGTFSGVYTVGGVSSDFNTLAGAIDAMNQCGISGNISLSLVSGTYEGLNISGSILGANDTTIVTITSATASAASVIFEGTPALTLKDVSHFAFKNVTFDASTGGYAVLFKGLAENLEISHCTILADPSGTASSTAGIYKASSSGTVDNVRMIGNMIDGGYYGIYFYGGPSQADYGYNITVDSNTITNQYCYGTFFYNADFTSVSHNIILSRLSNTTNDWYGLYFTFCNFIADGNKIHQRSILITSPNLASLSYTGSNNTTFPSVFSNNELIGYSTGARYGIYVGASNNLIIANNSIYMSGPGLSRNLHIETSTTSNYVIKNNMIVHAGSGYPIYVSGTTTPITSDYNCLYGTSYIGYLTSAHTTLASWQTATSQDANSVSVNPTFINANTSLELSDYSPFLVPRLNEVFVDINGTNRTTFTMMGAYSISLFEGYNLELTEIISPKNANNIYCFDDFTDVKVVIKNGGTENYYFDTNSVNIHLEVSGAYNYQSDTIINVGSLLSSKCDTFEIHDMLSVSFPGTYYVTVYLSSVLDTMYADDTLRMTYTVNKINLPYDVDFSTLPSELIINQVQGSVNWKVESGTGSNPTIAPIYGTGRLTFASESGMGSASQVILNGLDLRGTLNPKLEFWYAHDASAMRNDFVAVKISANGGASSQTLKKVSRYDAAYTTPGWTRYEVDLSAYDQASCLSLIIEANSFGGANQNIDRIRISSEQDIALTLIAPEEEDLIACKLDNKTLQVVVENMTSQVIDFDMDTTQIEIKISRASNQLYTYPLSGKLQGNSKDTFLITNVFDLSATGIYAIEAYIHSIDANASNDTSKKKIVIKPDLAIENIVGVDEINCNFMGDSVYVSFDIINKGNLAVNEIPVRLQINNANDIVDTIYFLLNVGDTISYAFTQAYVVPIVTTVQPYYIVSLKTELACDANNVNNSKNITACVEIPEVVDLRVKTVNKPIETLCDTGLNVVNVSVTLENAGTNDILSAIVHVEVDSAGVILASFSETTDAILSDATLVHVFTQSYIVPNFDGNYSVKVYVESITDDQDLTNDTLLVNACAILNDVSIYEVSELNWTLGQSIPNPARTMTRIPYAIPQDGKITFSVMSISGQVLYCEDIQSVAGSHQLEWNTETLSNGIYYYSMEYKGQCIVKKMTIRK